MYLSANLVHVRALNQKAGAVSRTLRDSRTCMVQYYGFGAASAAGKCGRGVGGSCAEVSSRFSRNLNLNLPHLDVAGIGQKRQNRIHRC